MARVKVTWTEKHQITAVVELADYDDTASIDRTDGPAYSALYDALEAQVVKVEPKDFAESAVLNRVILSYDDVESATAAIPNVRAPRYDDDWDE